MTIKEIINTESVAYAELQRKTAYRIINNSSNETIAVLAYPHTNQLLYSEIIRDDLRINNCSCRVNVGD